MDLRSSTSLIRFQSVWPTSCIAARYSFICSSSQIYFVALSLLLPYSHWGESEVRTCWRAQRWRDKSHDVLLSNFRSIMIETRQRHICPPCLSPSSFYICDGYQQILEGELQTLVSGLSRLICHLNHRSLSRVLSEHHYLKSLSMRDLRVNDMEHAQLSLVSMPGM